MNHFLSFYGATEFMGSQIEISVLTEFSPPYHVAASPEGFTVVDSKGRRKTVFSNRGEAEEIARMMNQQADFLRHFLSSREYIQ